MNSGNKGEWSEPYVFLRLLSEGKIHAADKELNRIENIFYPILEILRKEQKKYYKYSRESEVVIVSGDIPFELRFPIADFTENAALLLAEIKRNKGVFNAPEVNKFLNSLNYTEMKAPSKNKTDIQIKVHDRITGCDTTLGFSIKSCLGGKSTLLNASKLTNFVFKVNNSVPDNDLASQLNKVSGKNAIGEKLSNLNNLSFELIFDKMESSSFEANLRVIDSKLPEILALILKSCYSKEGTALKKLVNLLDKTNPLNYPCTKDRNYYEYKVKRLLIDVALGMVPNKPWTGKFDVTGGYIIVKEDGDIVCYHIYNMNDFSDYLLDNTYLETASTSRNDFGYFYKENGSVYIKLNMQIRFIK
ncbi:hypothetical protein B1778_00305 [Dehalococcoides mccartyi]|uniref:HpaII family restriction endonuclease n=1 Tax=Dehalococcoides mccartyi TaxID=61435 RepID=UPI0009C1D798|nr:HpaII family restriction endonuclease [Dehalococcoides mccartyi]AQU05223.1 hypothetical protein B1777_00450 [Dehalococcoides mccartyi]AQU06675.1 hypothetical protein B1778_00305 [Dehalococcoides mccartyi]